MRLRRVILWVLFLGALGWVGQTVATAGWSYFAVQEVVDKALREASARYRSALTAGTQRALDELMADVRKSILSAARREDLSVQEGSVSVAATSAGISATVRWSYPVVTYAGRDILVVPMSIQRSSLPPP